MMQGLPPDAGRLERYAAPPDTLVAVAEQALQQQHLLIADTSRPDALTRVVIARRPSGLFTNGEYVRVRIAPDSAGLMTVRVVTKPENLFDVGHRERAPRLFAAMDAQLDAAALGPWLGMRVRATPQGATAIIGTVARVSPDTLILQGRPGGAPPILEIGSLDGLAVSRGSYGHVREGMLIGALAGGLLGALIGNTDSGDSYQGLNVLVGIAVGSAAGTVVGGAVGASVRTEVWSPVRLH
jgi:hypothetical protein